jgi:hypothetical protein
MRYAVLAFGGIGRNDDMCVSAIVARHGLEQPAFEAAPRYAWNAGIGGHDVAVRGEHDAGHALAVGREAAEEAGLAGMRVNDIGPKIGNECSQSPESLPVAERRDVAAQLSDRFETSSKLAKGRPQGAFDASFRTGRHRHDMPGALKARDEITHDELGAATH